MRRLSNWSAEFIPREFYLPLTVALTVVTAAIFLCPAIAPSDRTNKADTTNGADQPNPITRRKHRATADFWNSARAPDPGETVSISSVHPEDLDVHPLTAPVDHPARIARAISENDLPALQSAAFSWFEQDPVAARDWLAMQSTYEDLQPAISFIASRISEKGDLTTALEWSALLPDGIIRDDTLFDIHALALRNGRITASEITLDAIPPERRADLLSGAAGD
jgi:hypothetical protein